jgi:hypothetical protein
MAKDKSRHLVMVGISIVNGVPRIRPLSSKEQKRFLKTHPNVQLPTFSPQEVIKGLELAMLPPSPFAENQLTGPRTTSPLGDPFAR